MEPAQPRQIQGAIPPTAKQLEATVLGWVNFGIVYDYVNRVLEVKVGL